MHDTQSSIHKGTSFFDDRGVGANFHVPRLIPLDIYHLPPAIGAQVTLSTKAQGTS